MKMTGWRMRVIGGSSQPVIAAGLKGLDERSYDNNERTIMIDMICSLARQNVQIYMRCIDGIMQMTTISFSLRHILPQSPFKRTLLHLQLPTINSLEDPL